jgi:hypothetical protein
MTLAEGVKYGAKLAKRTWPSRKRRDNAANCMRAAFFAARELLDGTVSGQDAGTAVRGGA